MSQNWHDLLFAHWPVETSALRPFTPLSLQIDSYEGQAWIGVIPFHMTGVRPRGIPPVPFFSAFPELNVRTYVTVQGKPGIFFYSLDAGNRLAVQLARKLFYLSYFHARMSWRYADGKIQYVSRRIHRGEPPAEFQGHYWPIGQPFLASPGSLADWLTERYCLYAVNLHGCLYRSEIHHQPWRLQQAGATIEINTMAKAQGILLPDIAPVLHFAKFQRAIIWGLEKVEAI